MTEPAKFNHVVSFLWAIADLLNGAFQKSMVLMFDTDLASGEGVARTVNDCCCGTGGMLPITKDHILQINPLAKVFLYGQDSRSEAQTDEVKTARRQRRFGLAQRARRVRRRGKPPRQLNPQTWAIARSDMLILEPEGKDAENIKLGSTLGNTSANSPNL